MVLGGVTGLIPMTGQTTQFLAAGGSSLVGSWLLIGLLIRVSDDARKPWQASYGLMKTEAPPEFLAEQAARRAAEEAELAAVADSGPIPGGDQPTELIIPGHLQGPGKGTVEEDVLSPPPGSPMSPPPGGATGQPGGPTGYPGSPTGQPGGPTGQPGGPTGHPGGPTGRPGNPTSRAPQYTPPPPPPNSSYGSPPPNAPQGPPAGPTRQAPQSPPPPSSAFDSAPHNSRPQPPADPRREGDS